jgi:hypothetical protein
MTERMDAEINPTLGHGTQRHMDLFRVSAAVVEQTRRAWIPRPAEFLPLEATIAVGIGFAALTRSGWVVHEEDDAAGTVPMTVREAEELARQSPGHDWRIHLVSPGMERHYKHVGEGQWKLYKWGAGLRVASGR